MRSRQLACSPRLNVILIKLVSLSAIFLSECDTQKEGNTSVFRPECHIARARDADVTGKKRSRQRSAATTTLRPATTPVMNYGIYYSCACCPQSGGSGASARKVSPLPDMRVHMHECGRVAEHVSTQAKGCKFCTKTMQVSGMICQA